MLKKRVVEGTSDFPPLPGSRHEPVIKANVQSRFDCFSTDKRAIFPWNRNCITTSQSYC